MNDFNIGYHVN